MAKTKDPFVFKVDYLTNQSLVNRLNLSGYNASTKVVQEIPLPEHDTSPCNVIRFTIKTGNKVLLETTAVIVFRNTAIKLLKKYKKSSIQNVI